MSCRAGSRPKWPSGRWSCIGRSARRRFRWPIRSPAARRPWASPTFRIWRALEHALARSQVIGHGTDEEARLFVRAAEEIRHLLHQFAAGFLRQPSPELLAALAEHELSSAVRLDAATAATERAGGIESEPVEEPPSVVASHPEVASPVASDVNEKAPPVP